MMEYRNPIKTPLVILTLTFGYSFLRGVYGWEIEDSMAATIGIVQVISLVHMWVVYNK